MPLQGACSSLSVPLVAILSFPVPSTFPNGLPIALPMVRSRGADGGHSGFFCEVKLGSSGGHGNRLPSARIASVHASDNAQYRMYDSQSAQNSTAASVQCSSHVLQTGHAHRAYSP